MVLKIGITFFFYTDNIGSVWFVNRYKIMFFWVNWSEPKCFSIIKQRRFDIFLKKINWNSKRRRFKLEFIWITPLTVTRLTPAALDTHSPVSCGPASCLSLSLSRRAAVCLRLPLCLSRLPRPSIDSLSRFLVASGKPSCLSLVSRRVRWLNFTVVSLAFSLQAASLRISLSSPVFSGIDFSSYFTFFDFYFLN